MLAPNKYPKINIGSKNELAKQISSKSLPYREALNLINDVLDHYNDYWYDSKRSEPEKGKYVRSAAKSPLGRLLRIINTKVLAPHDKLIPQFIFGGISGRNHIQAAAHLLGHRKRRFLLKTDLQSFFEQNREDRIFSLFYNKCGCSVLGARLLSQLCCVPFGEKGSKGNMVLARGFSTSPRLSVWCNLGTFLRLDWKVKDLLKNKDARISVYVDDIGISASNVDTEDLAVVSNAVQRVIEKGGLKINANKTKPPISFREGAEYVGARLGRNKLSLGTKSFKSLATIKSKIKNNQENKNELKKSLKGLRIYQEQLKKLGKTANNT